MTRQHHSASARPVAALEKAIETTTLELMHCGGTTPRQTFEVLLEEFPDLCRLFSKDEVIARCELIQKAEIPDYRNGGDLAARDGARGNDRGS